MLFPALHGTRSTARINVRRSARRARCTPVDTTATEPANPSGTHSDHPSPLPFRDHLSQRVTPSWTTHGMYTILAVFARGAGVGTHPSTNGSVAEVDA